MNVTYRQTDGWTDGQMTHCGITMLCIASCGKNCDIKLSNSNLVFKIERKCFLNTLLNIGQYQQHEP